MNPPQQGPDDSGDFVAFLIITVVLNAIVQGVKDKKWFGALLRAAPGRSAMTFGLAMVLGLLMTFAPRIPSLPAGSIMKVGLQALLAVISIAIADVLVSHWQTKVKAESSTPPATDVASTDGSGAK